jgi:hypothetical protein
MLLSHGAFYMSERAATQRQFPAPCLLSALRAAQIRLHFAVLRVYKTGAMEVPTSLTAAATPKNVIGLSLLFLVLAAIFGLLNGQKVRTLRMQFAHAETARDGADLQRMTQEKDLKGREAGVVAAAAKAAELEGKARAAQAEVAQLQAEKADLQTKLQANQAEVASLQRRTEEAGAKPENPGAPSGPELQAQLDEARHQLESAERENAFLSEKINTAQTRSTQLEDVKKRRHEISPVRSGVRGTVLAVNQAYNFVVLNLGGRQGVEPNTEMLVVRDGTLIGKIRVSSVEPSTAIGDIITSSLERGVQVQPGDIVVYAGTNS